MENNISEPTDPKTDEIVHSKWLNLFFKRIELIPDQVENDFPVE